MTDKTGPSGEPRAATADELDGLFVELDVTDSGSVLVIDGGYSTW